jgi:hypothetical protein
MRPPAVLSFHIEINIGICRIFISQRVQLSTSLCLPRPQVDRWATNCQTFPALTNFYFFPYAGLLYR